MHSPAILQHALAEIERARAIWLVEFLPWSATRQMATGESYMEFLHARFHIYEGNALLEPEETQAFVEKVTNSPTKMTDLTLVPRRTELAEAFRHHIG